MPMFTWVCQECEHEFERIIHDRDKTPEACPECECEEVERANQFASFSIKYEADGFYSTDYEDKNID